MLRIRTLTVLLLVVAPSTAQTGLWHALTPAISPAPRWNAAMAYDSLRDRTVLVGGLLNQSTANGVQETWEFDGSDWLLRGTIGPYGGEGEIAATFDDHRNVTVVVWDAFPNCQTWEWDGTAWSQRTSPHAPPGRAGHALAYDSIRQCTVLFGGRANTFLADTWEWDGTDWTQRSSGGPVPRGYHAMAFDAARGQVVLFGGYDAAAVYADTWVWNGAYWLEHFGILGPASRSNHAMTYDSARQRIVLCGGRHNLGFFQEYMETWEWNGASWTNTAAPVPVPSSAAVAFDSTRQRTVLFGGRNMFSNIQNGTYGYGAPAVVASASAYGSGCAGPTGVPNLSTVGAPHLGSTFHVTLSNLPAGVTNIPLGWLGFDNAMWNGVPLPVPLDPFGFPGCSALLAPSQAFAFVNNGGTAAWSLAIPFAPVFAGLTFFLQGGVLVLGFNPGGVVFTRGLACTIGS